MKKKIFAIDDEEELLEIIRINLGSANFDVELFSSAEKALEQLKKNIIPDLILLDIMMDGMDGYEFCKALRENAVYQNIPVIFLSAKSEEFDKVLGLELGGDDYLTKPFSIKELISRIKAVLRRSSSAGSSNTEKSSSTQIIKYKGLELNPESYRLTIDSKNVKLTKTEFELLHLFLRTPEKVFSRDNIIDSVRGNNVYVVDRTIDVHIMNLRKKLGPYKNIVTTFSGVGYGFKETE
ncbi:MAG: response regulator [Spirochaetes bacterium]|nr:response regulator [Spirochaetota bacterium]